jgi:CheY-specific phosphatase CheX
MKTAAIEAQEWLDSFTAVVQDFASGSLRFDGAAVPTETVSVKSGTNPAAYISVLSESNSMHLGLSASMQGCRTLTRAFLGVREKDGISEKDVVDAMSEILNILAGKVKSRLASRDGSLRLGLPIFLVGQIQVTANMDRAVCGVDMGPVPCQLLVFRNRGAA